MSRAFDPHERPGLAAAVEGRTVVDNQTDPSSVEAYRRLAASLHLMQIQTGTRSLMVSSGLPRDGKTLTSTNLALTLSESYDRRVLLIDADLRRPSIHEVFQLSYRRGLSEALRGEPMESLPLIQVSPRLAILPAGHPDASPMAALTSERMRDLIREASQSFDWVILDTPPAALLSDANLLTALVDGVVLVISAGTTHYAAVKRAIEEFGAERIVGVVLNRVTEAEPARKYARHYYRSSRYGSSSNGHGRL
jgi:capsular exopolysaccharide synthesis family protein